MQYEEVLKTVEELNNKLPEDAIQLFSVTTTCTMWFASFGDLVLFVSENTEWYDDNDMEFSALDLIGASLKNYKDEVQTALATCIALGDTNDNK